MLSSRTWPRLPIPAGSPARVWWPLLRRCRYRRGQVGAVLVLAACAVLAGCRSFTAIGEWVANASDQALAVRGSASPEYSLPHGLTIGPDGALWIALDAGAVARIDISGWTWRS
ncbi:MAG: hypothetical protein ACREQ5_27350 [Candidatus Dormibacteria bacterium]